MKYLSLFSGIGGFELGIGDKGECIGFSEIDKYAISIYQKHFPEHKNYGDITKINENELPDFDFLCGGFPCQSFSIAGKRGGFADTRGTLFFDIARILKAKKPRLFLLENVKGLLSHDNGNTFKTIISTLDELGYDLQWQVLNSKNFGVPQNRERVFIVGHLRGTSRPEVFPVGESVTDDKGENQIANTISANYWKGVGASRSFIQEAGYKPNNLNSERRTAHTIRSSGRGSGIEKKQNWDSYKIGGKVRRLTPTECERLQSFPDSWTEGVSDTQRYKCLGNAVTVNVIKEIVKRIFHE